MYDISIQNFSLSAGYVDVLISKYPQFKYMFYSVNTLDELDNTYTLDDFDNPDNLDRIDFLVKCMQQSCDNLVYELHSISSPEIQEYIKIGFIYNWQLRCNYLLYNGYSRESLEIKECVDNGAVVKEIYIKLKKIVEKVVEEYLKNRLSKYIVNIQSRKMVASEINILQDFLEYLLENKITCIYTIFEAVKLIIPIMVKLVIKKMVYESFDEISYRESVMNRGFTSVNEYNSIHCTRDYYSEFMIMDGKYIFNHIPDLDNFSYTAAAA